MAPGEFKHSQETTWRAASSALRVSGFKASRDGLFVTVTVLGSESIVDPIVGFGGPNPSSLGGPNVWLEVGQRTVLSEIQRGSVLHPEQPGEPAVSSLDLWFPFDLGVVGRDALLHVSWPSAFGSEVLRVTANDMRDAASNALVWGSTTT